MEIHVSKEAAEVLMMAIMIGGVCLLAWIARRKENDEDDEK